MAERPHPFGSLADPLPLQRHQSFGPSAECNLCYDMTLKALASADGYRHAPDRKSLIRSAKTCKFCSYIFRKNRLGRDAALILRLSKNRTDEVDFHIEHVGTSSQSSDGPRRKNVRLKVFAKTDDAALAYGVSLKHELTNTTSEESFRFARQNLERCVRDHDCGTPLPFDAAEGETSLRPARIIDVNYFEECSDVRLVTNRNLDATYIALSYCWGKSQPFITTFASLSQHQIRIIYESLPKTYQDVITIARRLEIRYIWIDALCIVQDDEVDWQREAAKMGSIYSKAYCTIAAEASSDSDGGCFNMQSTSQEVSQEQTPFELHLGTHHGIRSTLFLWNPVQGTWRSSHPELDASPLSERGWVCQERILSPRILHYTSTQIFWECRHSLSAEDGLQSEDDLSSSLTLARNNYGPSLARQLYRKPRTMLSPLDAIQQPVTPLLVTWYNSVIAASYSRRQLTKSDDKLLAISGVARVFDHHLAPSGIKYVAGLWLVDPDSFDFDIDAAARIAAQSLSWQRKGPSRKPTQYRAPSFSWAAIDAQVEWPVQLGGVRNIASSQNTIQETLDAAIEVVDVHINARDINDRFGRVSEGSYLELNGVLSTVTIIARKKLSMALGGPPVSTPTLLRPSLSSTTITSMGSDSTVMSMSAPSLLRSTSGATVTTPTVTFTWDAYSTTQKWGGTAYMDDDLLQPVRRDGGVGEAESNDLLLEDGLARTVKALLLEKAHRGGRSRYLLIEPCKEGHGSSNIPAYRRIGIAVFDGYDDVNLAGSASQPAPSQTDQNMIRFRIY